MTYRTLRVSKDGQGRVRLELNRPSRRNAFDSTMLRELHDCIQALNADPEVRLVVVSGVGEHFCAGRDTAELAAVAEVESNQLLPPPGGHESSMFRTLQMPVVALLDGSVVGGGLGFALQCDLRIATTRSRFLDGHLIHGMAPSVAVWYLPRLTSIGRALEFCAQAEPIEAYEAMSLGLVDAVVEPEDLEAELERSTSGLVAADPRLVRHTKALLRTGSKQAYADTMSGVGYLRAVERLART